MSRYPYRLQALWITLLALAWLGLCSPWPNGVNALLAVVVTGAAIVAFVWVTRRLRAQYRATVQTLAALDGSLRALPADLKRHTPLVITVGDPQAMACVWGEDTVRVTDAAIWVRGESPSTLIHLADALKRWRGGQGPDAVVLLVAADQDHGDADATVAWKAWRSALSAVCRTVGYALPVGVAVYAASTRDDTEASPWFGVSGAAALDAKDLPAVIAPRLQQYVRVAIPIEPELRARRAAWLNAGVRWASTAFLPMWMEGRTPWRVTAFAVATVPGLPAPRTRFGQFVTQITGLIPPSADRLVVSRYPLPDAVLTGMPRQPVRRAWPRALGHALIGLAVFFVAGTAASAWQNRALMQRVADNVARYQSIPASQDAARVDALAAVKRDRDELERYANAGVPMRLSFGLYRGTPWLPVANRLIASYQPPAPPPSMIELDSMAMFNSGSAVLNPGSNRVLVGALEMIKAHPGKRVLVAGYTDSTGNPSSNQQLSEARAAAVRDWLTDASGLSPTHFAIQGYGDTRPKASNDTVAGRAANRRVAITLIPDCRDDRSSRSTEGRPACS
ncbi:OmpA family protein [Dyella sp. M7H15-1]|uniref:OmpA family protein n=1 Tax=Dyella sp. M7H15-1 TaxID=2501295 RepID=UPI001004F409|nr:OmpA family protein [Dyella sp. M7H15-1]QAU23556.1 OmpA family protein [Dyella sp. M7H15-1]